MKTTPIGFIQAEQKAFQGKYTSWQTMYVMFFSLITQHKFHFPELLLCCHGNVFTVQTGNTNFANISTQLSPNMWKCNY